VSQLTYSVEWVHKRHRCSYAPCNLVIFEERDAAVPTNVLLDASSHPLKYNQPFVVEWPIIFDSKKMLLCGSHTQVSDRPVAG
jgi:hypothetical protein